MWANAGQMWHLDTGDLIKEYTWWWWWWLVFLEPPSKDLNPRQLMILWSTKNCDEISVNDYRWRRKGGLQETPDGYRFNGMTAAWYYDGRCMHDPLVLEENMFRVIRRGGAPDHEGQLLPSSQSELSLTGRRDDYRLNIVNREVDLRFRFTPLGRELSTHRFKSNRYAGKFGYNIYKIYGMRADAKLRIKNEGDPASRGGHHPIGGAVPMGHTEETVGTAYFQKLKVNAPGIPWMWGLFQMDDGSFIDYMIPHTGLNIFRRSKRARSTLDRGSIKLSRKMEFYDAERDELHHFNRVRVKRTYREGMGYENRREPLPTFHVEIEEKGYKLRMTLESYSRAVWSFRQPFLGFIPTRLFYNEYPARMTSFDLRGPGGYHVSRDRWDTVHGNCEYSWGFLL